MFLEKRLFGKHRQGQNNLEAKGIQLFIATKIRRRETVVCIFRNKYSKGIQLSTTTYFSVLQSVLSESGTMEMNNRNRQVTFFFLSLCMYGAICNSIQYSVPEERKAGSLVANVLKDLKVDAKNLSDRRARLVSKSTNQYFQLDPHSGNMILKEKIDREALCGQNDHCVLLSEIVLEDPLKLYRIEVQIEDVNDNSPKFSKDQFIFEIPEQTHINTVFPLERAQDSDKGENTVQNYTLSPNKYFRLDVQSHSDGTKYADLVLEKPLDREVEAQVFLILSAVDGGIPRKTGTAQIIIDVLDINDNAPLFNKSMYHEKLMENSPLETLVTRVEARDKDIGSNADITYSFSQVPENVQRSFRLNKNTGELTISGIIDYEENTNYEMKIRATDGGGLSAYCKVIVEIEDENDNAPEISIASITSPLPEDSPPDTVVALFSVTDVDSGESGRTACTTEVNLPFVLKPTENNYYQLVTQQPLDREKVSEYNITITATDQGSPRLTSTRILHVQISDVNDNPPVFEKPFYEMQLRENNIPGLLINSVHAVDLDTAQNAKVTYSLLPGKVNDGPTSAYISINSETGNLYAIRSLDYEEVKDFHVTVRAVDSGSPPLSSEVTICVQVVDENDNAPFILYPLQNGTSPSNDLVPRGAETGYLVTKVVAVDRDSAQNSWLSYQLLKATEPGLFTVGAQNGEVTTLRPVSNRDSFKQNLIVVVRDNGHPPQSTSATLRILLVDGFSDPYLKSVALPKEETAEEEDPNLTMYLIICLAAISSIFLISVVAFVVIKMQKREKFIGTYNSAANFPVGPDSQEISADPGAGSLSQAYNYEVCLAGGSLNSEFRFLRPLFPVFSVEPPNTQQNPRSSNVSEEVPRHAGESQHVVQARASLSEESAPRSGAPGCTVNQATGANMNCGQNDWLTYQ
nr:protocadherin beta-16-like isoform X1 [Zootoca vivipara]